MKSFLLEVCALTVLGLVVTGADAWAFGVRADIECALTADGSCQVGMPVRWTAQAEGDFTPPVQYAWSPDLFAPPERTEQSFEVTYPTEGNRGYFLSATDATDNSASTVVVVQVSHTIEYLGPETLTTSDTSVFGVATTAPQASADYDFVGQRVPATEVSCPVDLSRARTCFRVPLARSGTLTLQARAGQAVLRKEVQYDNGNRNFGAFEPTLRVLRSKHSCYVSFGLSFIALRSYRYRSRVELQYRPRASKRWRRFWTRSGGESGDAEFRAGAVNSAKLPLTGARRTAGPGGRLRLVTRHIGPDSYRKRVTGVLSPSCRLNGP